MMIASIKKLLSPNNKKLPAQKAALLIAVTVLIIGVVSSLFLASVIHRQANDEFVDSLLQRNNALRSQFSSALGGYGHLLYGGSSLFSLKGEVSREEWHKFYLDMKVQEELPDTLGVGFVPYVTKDRLAALEEQVRTNDYPEFTVTPTNPRSDYTAILYLEPLNEVNKKAIGYDMFSEPQRNAAMTLARDTGKVAMSSPVQLVQDTGDGKVNDDPLGVLVYYPVYSTSYAPTTIDQRRDQLRGFVYVAVRPQDVLDSYLANVPQISEDIDIKVQDITDGSEGVLGRVNKLSPGASNKQSIVREVVIANRTWQVTTIGRPPVVSSTVLPLASVLAGSLVSVLLSAFMLQFLLKRIARVEHSYAAEVERTKDELLALASHQLRTPASGVKQYIGILTSGIMGELTPAQQQIAEKAYNTNERQIEIINQLLYVSKIEAGKITIRPSRSNITPIIQRIVDQSEPNAERKNVKINFRTKKEHYLYGDEQYYPMIIDNLISNAIKYSHPKTSVSIKVSERGDMVAVSVVDHGVGVAVEDQGQLFQKFNRIENPLSRSEGGSGLGLYLAYQLARAHGGDIEVRSTVGKGSTFTLLLPKKRSIAEAVVDIADYSGDILPR
jgi:signal transduction histidine kinase